MNFKKKKKSLPSHIIGAFLDETDVPGVTWSGPSGTVFCTLVLVWETSSNEALPSEVLSSITEVKISGKLQ